MTAQWAHIAGWYDSNWLRAFLQAKALLGESRPDKIAEFVENCQKLVVPKSFEAKHMRGLLDTKALSDFNSISHNLCSDDLEMDEFVSHGRI